jgi:serine/threonine protein kinase/tetratricopeptide (TPR) repeat protein
MDSGRWRKIRQLFEDAVALEGKDRARFLNEACADDVELEAEIIGLLANAGKTDEDIGRIVSGAAAAWATHDEDRRQKTVGRYRILELLGEGGMGKVYLADRADEQYRQRVAIKIVGRHGATSDILNRFRAERQILANLDHPNISHLLDGGETEDGLPYLVMEHVQGRPIVAYCQEEELSLDERLDLFLDVCAAVDHAHRNLVVHRDIKPGNILVTDKGVPKLLDFGIAKLLEAGSPGGSPAVTRADLRLLTPEYASPEQVLGRPITVATDVYGLGLVLYELLTDRYPYGVREELATDWRRIICEANPALPSTIAGRPARSDNTVSVHERGPAVPDGRWRRRRARLRGDLDNIVMSAIRKEPERRYASPRALADDIRAYRSHRPVAARPDTARYRLTKFVRRHRAGVAAATAGVMFTVALIAFYTHRLSEERDHARTAAATSAKVVQFMTGLFREADPRQSLGQPVTARVLLERGARRLEQELADEPAVRATMVNAIADSFSSMGEFKPALEQYEETLAALRKVYPEDHPEVAEAWLNLGRIRVELGDYDNAAADLAKAQEIVAADESTDTEFRARVAKETGQLKRQTGEYDAAAALFSEAIGMLRGMGPDGRSELASALFLYSGLLEALDRNDDALLMMEETLEIRRNLHGDLHPDVAMTLNSLGSFYLGQGELDAADRHWRQSLELKRALYGSSNIRVARSLANLAIVQHRRGRYQESLELSAEALPIFVDALGEDHPHVAFLLENMANDHLALGRHEEALAAYRASQDKMRRIFGEEHVEYGISLSNLGGAYIEMQRYEEAMEPLQRADRIFVKALGPEHGQVFSNRAKIASVLFGLGRFEAAEAELRDILATTENLYDAHTDIANPRELLGRTLLAEGRVAEAEAALRQSVTDWRAATGDDTSNVWRAAAYHAETLAALGRFGEAAALIEASYRSQLEEFGPEHPNTETTRKIANRLYLGWDRPADAARFE